MPLLQLDLDILVISVLVAMIAIGYFTGVTVEIIKLIQVVIPFLVIFYFGGTISRFVFKSTQFRMMIRKVPFLDVPFYYNTLIMFLSTFVAFFGTFYILSLIVRFIRKKIQSEMVTYKLGRINHILGGIIAPVRFYILASLLILPFFLLGITNKEDDFTTKIMMEHPPQFTRIGHLINSSAPTINATHSLIDFYDVIDLNQLKGKFKTISDLPTKLAQYDEDITLIYQEIQMNKKPGSTFEVTVNNEYDMLLAFTKDPNKFLNATDNQETITKINKKNEEIGPYSGLIIWSIEGNVFDLDHDTMIKKYNEDFNTIIENTQDQKIIAELTNAYKGSSIYLIVKDWLQDECDIVVDSTNLTVLLNDANMETILEHLVLEYETEHTKGLIYDLKALGYEDINLKLDSIQTFVKNYYNIYKPIMENMQVELNFKYKLIASTLTKVQFVDSLKRSPVLAMWAVDSIEMFNSNMSISGETFYQTLIKIVIPVYIIKQNEQGVIETLDKTRMDLLLKDLDQAVDDVILTEQFIIEMVYALVTSEYTNEMGETGSYLEYLVDNGDITKDALNSLYNYSLFKNSSDSKIQTIKSTLNEVGELNE